MSPAASQAASQLCLCLQLFSLNPWWHSQEKFQSTALCCWKQRDGHTRKPDPDALNFWMGRAERTLTCLWGHGLGLRTILVSRFWLSLSLTHTLAVVCSLSLSLSLSSSSTGQRSSCRWSWLSWNCRATFPVVLATSCSISRLMTALLQDYWCCEDVRHLDAHLHGMLGFMAGAFVVINMFSWFRSEVFLQQKCLGSAKWGEIHRWVK